MSGATPLILSFGSVNIDVTARARHIPKPGQTIHAESYFIALGGKGSNQAAATGRLARSLPVRAALAGRVGTDPFGIQARKKLLEFGVDLTALRDDPDTPTGLALIIVDDTSGENSITVAGGANMAVTIADIDDADALFSAASVLMLQLELPVYTVLEAAKRAKQAGATVILDPAPVPEGGLPAQLWPLIDIITPNESETLSLVGLAPETTEDAARAAAMLINRGVRATVVKMGARGVWWQDETGSGFIPPFTVTAVDTVAAGDCFNAGLATSLALGQNLAEATRVAAACGALATTRYGAAQASPEWEDVAALLRHST
ncbi:ribokinase [Acetobacter oeni]|uniref:Ribokinase n=1 Tax=Acetobacter oeni TaxID=304077 RepID=A0A511XK83_9PROT|nr:ribokinase [Acetobacter oeni]MBB3883893.1 ribokinase [Acetobacter oeni]NHO19817.1 ribokinase [Acetobacter oeni]GBR03457.1 ribokinase [Acetobacter oeni LMG 21952]GEN63354.1 ribokinase [Acetobacter oeni]